jgi:hypothetical protein
MLGRTFTEHVSKFKLDRAYKKAEKMIDTLKKDKDARIIEKPISKE